MLALAERVEPETRSKKKMPSRTNKWIGKVVTPKEKGKFGDWCKSHGYKGGVSAACIEKAKHNKSAHVRGMANFAERARKPGGFSKN